MREPNAGWPDVLPVPRASDRTVWSAERLDQPTLSALRDRAMADLSKPWPVPLASGFARYARDGDRVGYESAVFARDGRLSRAAVMAAVTLDPLWIDEVVDGVSLLCEQSTWCWPAHDDVFRRGAVVPDVTRPYLDLGAGEAVAQLAWIDHLLGAQLDERAPGLRARIRREAEIRVLRPFVERRDWHWLHDVHNWSAWIHGNVVVAGLALAGSPDRIIALAAEGLDRYVASIPPDGAIDEGAGYWWLGAARALEALDILGRELTPALRATVAFPHRMHLGAGWQLNFADSVARIPSGLPWDALHRAARKAGDAQALAFAAAHRGPADEVGGLGWLLRALTDAEWRKTEPFDSPPPPPEDEVWLPSTQVFRTRDPAGLTLAVKGGHNGEHHNHNDVGSIVIALRGVPVIVDPGRPTYTAQTFGPDRYEIWTMQSSWHSVPEIRGTAQAVGAEYRARAVEVLPDGISLDLAAAYPGADVVRWRRAARLDRRVTVRESWTLEPRADEQPTRIHLMVAGRVELGAGQAAITALEDAGTVQLRWDPAVPATMTTRPLDDPMLHDVWGDHLTRLELDVTGLGPVGALTWTLESPEASASI
jgi:hypothetical protein